MKDENNGNNLVEGILAALVLITALGVLYCYLDIRKGIDETNGVYDMVVTESEALRLQITNLNHQVEDLKALVEAMASDEELAKVKKEVPKPQPKPQPTLRPGTSKTPKAWVPVAPEVSDAPGWENQFEF